MNLGPTLRIIRKKSGFTSERLAEISRVTQSTISDIENDKRSPTIETIEKLANALGVPFISLLPSSAYLTQEDLDRNDEIKELAQLFDLLTQKQRKQLIIFLHSLVEKD